MMHHVENDLKEVRQLAESLNPKERDVAIRIYNELNNIVSKCNYLHEITWKCANRHCIVEQLLAELFESCNEAAQCVAEKFRWIIKDAPIFYTSD